MPSRATAAMPHSSGRRNDSRISSSEHTRKPTAWAERIRPQPASPMSVCTARTGPSVLSAPLMIALSAENASTTTQSQVVLRK